MPTPATAQRTPETIPDDRVLGEYEAGSRVTFFLKATMPVFTVLVQGGNNVSFQVRRPYEWPTEEIAGKPRVYNVRIAGKVQVSGLVHERALAGSSYGFGLFGDSTYGGASLGGPTVSVKFTPAGLARSRGLGTIAVSTSVVTPPVIPPVVPPPGTSSTLSGGPRSIRGVRRRVYKDR
jgi:hypothetical protein